MSDNANRIELPPRTTFGLGDLGLEQAEIDLAVSLMKKRHRGNSDELIRTAAFMGLHQMMTNEIEAQQTRTRRTNAGVREATPVS
jgi:hypothetical protein